MEWHSVRKIAQNWQSEIEQKWPKYYNEMQGKLELNDTILVLSSYMSRR